MSPSKIINLVYIYCFPFLLFYLLLFSTKSNTLCQEPLGILKLCFCYAYNWSNRSTARKRIVWRKSIARNIFFRLDWAEIEHRNQRSNNKTQSSKVYLITLRRRARTIIFHQQSQFLSLPACCWWSRLKNALACQTNNAQKVDTIGAGSKNAPFCALVCERISYQSTFLRYKLPAPNFHSTASPLCLYPCYRYRVTLIGVTTIIEMRIFGLPFLK